MLRCHLGHHALKRALAAEPLVDHHAQRILIAGRARVRLNLLRRHIGHRADHLLRVLVARTLRDNRDAKIREQYRVAPIQQHILRLDVAVNQLVFVGILKGIRHLPHIDPHRLQRHHAALGMALAQRAIGGIIHHQKGRALVQSIIQQVNNMRMGQLGNRLRLIEKALGLLLGQFAKQDLNRSLRPQARMLAQIDLGKAAMPQQADQTIVPKLLAHTICHSLTPPVWTRRARLRLIW